MRSILTVTTAATSPVLLATLERVKQELEIADASKDVLLTAKLREASSDCEAYLGFRVARESVSQTFWHDPNDGAPEYLILRRTPVATLTSVTLDDELLDASEYRLDAETGQLYALTTSGYPTGWMFSKSIVVAYAGGYVLPGTPGYDLPAGIEGAAVDLVTDFWSARGRDPSVKGEEVPGAYRVDYWVGAVGETGELPARVQMKLAPYRRVRAA